MIPNNPILQTGWTEDSCACTFMELYVGFFGSIYVCMYVYIYMQQRDCWILVYACLISKSIATMENSMEVP